MPEHDRTGEPAGPDTGDETGERLGGVDGVDEDPLGPGQEPCRVVAGGGRVAVTCPQL